MCTLSIYSRAMGIRLVYGLKTRDQGYLETFFPSRRIAEAARLRRLDYQALIFDPDVLLDYYVSFCISHVAILRGELPQALYDILEANGIQVVNSSASTMLAHDKIVSADWFKRLAAHHPETVLIDRREKAVPLAWPFVAKPRYGRMGYGVRLIEDQNDWNALLDSIEFQGNEYIAQELIAASKGIDVRFFFAAFDGTGHASSSMWRPMPTTGQHGISSICAMRRGTGFLSNAHTGGSMEHFDAPAGLRNEAERIFKASGLNYGTVDFLIGDTEGTRFPVCEINANPGFEELERVSGLDVAGAILASASMREISDAPMGGTP